MLKRAIVEHVIYANLPLRSHSVYELTPHYVDPVGTGNNPYRFYEVNKLEYYQKTSDPLTKVTLQIMLGGTMKQSWRGEFSYQKISKTPLIVTPTVVQEQETIHLLPTVYFVLYILSQLGGLLYLCNIILSPLLN